jgi:hypothetical protein
MSAMTLCRQKLLMKLGAPRERAHTAWRLFAIDLAEQQASFSFTLERIKLRQARRREGRYLPTSPSAAFPPSCLWRAPRLPTPPFATLDSWKR